MADEDGTPSFAEVVKAFTPEGTDFEAFKTSLHSQGAPARISPELVAALNAGGIVPKVIAHTGPCSRCDHEHAGGPGPACLEAERRYGRSPLRRSPDLQLDAIRGPSQSEQVFADPAITPLVALPPDPTRPGAVAATAMHEVYLDLIAGGFTEDQALSIIAKAYVEANRE